MIELNPMNYKKVIKDSNRVELSNIKKKNNMKKDSKNDEYVPIFKQLQNKLRDFMKRNDERLKILNKEIKMGASNFKDLKDDPDAKE